MANELGYLTDGQQPDPQMTPGTRPVPANGSSENFRDAVTVAAELIGGKKPDDKTNVDTQAHETDQEPVTRDNEETAAGAESGDAEQPGNEEGDKDSQESGEESTEEKTFKTVKELAEKLGVEQKELYGVEFTLRNGSTVSLGQMKDAAERLDGADSEYAEREQKLNNLEIELYNSRQQVAQFEQVIRDNASPETVEQMQQQQQATMAQELASLRAAAPELKEQAKFDQFREDTVKYLGRWGFKPHELQIADHRVLLVLKHAMALEARLDGLAKLKPKTPAVRPRKKQVTKPNTEQKRRPVEIGIDEQVEAVAKLIGG